MRRASLIAAVATLAFPAVAGATSHWIAIKPHPVRRAAHIYITTPESSRQHVGRCRTLRPHEFRCVVAFDDIDSVTLNGEIVSAHFNGVVFVRHTLHGFRCTYDPGAFAWEPC